MRNIAEVNSDEGFGFKVTCKQCLSDNVAFTNDLGWSSVSGGWGKAALQCTDCGKETVLVEN